MKSLIHPLQFGSGKNYLHAVSLALLAGSSLLLAQAADGTTKQLFNGRDMTGWRKPAGEWMAAAKVSPDSADPKKFAIQPGASVLVNGPNGRTVNLISESEHGDVEAHLEFAVPKGSNSGIYFQARYEIQVFDSWGVEKPAYSDCGGIYERWMTRASRDTPRAPTPAVRRENGKPSTWCFARRVSMLQARRWRTPGSSR